MNELTREIEGCPKFNSMMAVLFERVFDVQRDGSIIHRTGAEEEQQASMELKASRLQYLEARVLYDELVSYLEDKEADYEEVLLANPEPTDNELSSSDQSISHFREVYNSFYDMQCAQRLSLGPNPEDPTQSINILGLSVEDFQHPVSSPASTTLVRDIESRLVEKSKEVEQFWKNSGAQTRLPDLLTATPTQVGQVTRNLVRGCSRAARTEALAEHTRIMQAHLEDLTQKVRETCKIYSTIIKEHRLVYGAEQTTVEVCAQTANLEALLGKLQDLECELLMATYNSETKPALKNARKFVDTAFDAAKLEAEETVLKLEEYKAVDADFDEIAKEYAKISEQLEHDRFALSSLKKDFGYEC